MSSASMLEQQIQTQSVYTKLLSGRMDLGMEHAISQPLTVIKKLINVSNMLIVDKQIKILIHCDQSVIRDQSFCWRIYQSIVHNQISSAISNSREEGTVRIIVRLVNRQMDDQSNSNTIFSAEEHPDNKRQEYIHTIVYDEGENLHME